MIEQLVEKIVEANKAYRVGKPIMSDTQYDILIDELRSLDPENELLNIVGHEVQDESRKRKLPIPMASMNKVKTLDEIMDWSRLKGINPNQTVVITPKYDGLSLCVNELTGEAWTRGDGEFGQKSDEHYKLIGNHLENLPQPWPKAGGFHYTFGEVMMPKKVFIDKYSQEFANPRNLVAGLLNSPDPREGLKDTIYIKYGAVLQKDFEGSGIATKSQLLKDINDGQEIRVPFEVISIKDLTNEHLSELFKSWSQDFEIDGLILEVDYLETQEQLGRETSSNNPVWARAFKHPSFEQSAETEIIGISWNISKQGLLKPVLHINPVKLDGVTVSNVTGNNARFVKDMGLGVGAKVLVKRSGMVIPIIADVITPVEFQMPYLTDSEGEIDYIWNEAGIELITLYETDDQKLKKNIAFFEILEADNVSEGVIKQLWDAGYKTIKDILNLTTSDLEKIDRFGKRKAVIVYNSIQKCSKGVTLSKLQHATGIFKGLGSRKLALLEHFTSKPTIDQVLEVEGFAEISAQSYIDGYDKFNQFIDGLPITIQEKAESVKVSNDLDGMNFVFTGFRRTDLESVIESRGGKIGSGVSKTTTHLIMKAVGSGSSKEKKAIELGVKIMTVEQLENLLN
jgi:NAD-dependent DNA ligase